MVIQQTNSVVNTVWRIFHTMNVFVDKNIFHLSDLNFIIDSLQLPEFKILISRARYDTNAGRSFRI